MTRVTVYTDGSAIGNPGPGGYGVVLFTGEHRKELSGGFRRTTNNRMEILAAIKALESLNRPCQVTLHSDSRYVVDAMTKGWAKRWKAKDWWHLKREYVRNGGKAVPVQNTGSWERVSNPDLWDRLLSLVKLHTVEFRWVRGHSGVPENERADFLAVAAARGKDLLPDLAYELHDGVVEPDSPVENSEQTPDESSTLKVFVCSSVVGNPGPGGFGVVVSTNEAIWEISGGYRHTTNNRMDILGTIKALESLQQSSEVEVRSGNDYLLDAISKGWVLNWQKKGWIGEKNRPTPNRDLWERLLILLEQHAVNFHWLPEYRDAPEYQIATKNAISMSRRADLSPDDAYEAEHGRTTRARAGH